MRVVKTLLIGLISLNLAFAENAVVLNKDDKAPWDGILLTREKVQELKNNTIERDGLLKINTSFNTSLNLQSDIITKQQEKVTLLLEQNDRLAKAAHDNQMVNDWVKAGYFIGGIVITGLVFWGYGQIQR